MARFLFILLITNFANGQSLSDIFFGANNRGQFGLNQQRTRSPQRQQNYEGNSRPQQFGGNSVEFMNDAAFRNLPIDLSSLNSVRNPGRGSSNNVIGNTAYNTVGNRNSVIQNNP